MVAPGYQPTFFNKTDPLKGPLEAKLKPRPATNPPPSQIILGRVVNASREPVPNAVVSVDMTQIGNTGHGFPPKGTGPLAVTDERGEFFLQSLVKFDSMQLSVEARGYARGKFNEVRPGQKRHDLSVTEGVSLTGRVLLNGQPLKDVTIGVAGVDRSMGNYVGDFVMGTREGGKFFIPNLPPNTQYVLYGLMDSLRPFGALPVRTITLKGDGSMEDAGTLEVAPGLRLAGQVKLADDKPLPAHSRLIIGRPEAWDTLTVELPADGRFDVLNLPAETFTVGVSLKGYRLSSRNASLDRYNPFQMTGRLDANKTNLTVLLESGKDVQPDYSSTPEDEIQRGVSVLHPSLVRQRSSPRMKLVSSMRRPRTFCKAVESRCSPGRACEAGCSRRVNQSPASIWI